MRVFAPSTVDAVVERIEGEQPVLDIGSAGMVVLTGRRAGGTVTA